jgi:hypothetical protein
MSTKSQQTIYGGAIMGAEIRAKRSLSAAANQSSRQGRHVESFINLWFVKP